jgi:hypothetical protein
VLTRIQLPDNVLLFEFNKYLFRRETFPKYEENPLNPSGDRR